MERPFAPPDDGKMIAHRKFLDWRDQDKPLCYDKVALCRGVLSLLFISSNSASFISIGSSRLARAQRFPFSCV